MGHQVKEWQPHKGADWLHIEKKDSMHYNPLADKQIRVPIGDINKLRNSLKKGNQLENLNNFSEESEEEQTLTRKKPF